MDHHRLYSDFKFYRATKIKQFLDIRHYRYYDFNSLEYKIYSNYLLNWIKHNNSNWTKVKFIKNLNPSSIND